MGLNRSLEDAHIDLQLSYAEAKAQFHKDNPTWPRVQLNETQRSMAVMTAYYAQGRKPLAEVNRLRELAGLEKIGAAEGKRKVTNSLPGTSPHGKKPSGAIDVVMIDRHTGVALYDPKYLKYYIAFGGYMLAAGSSLLTSGKITHKIVWGQDWNGDGINNQTFYDTPHFELKGWQNFSS
jgi:hypothetical protein